MESSLAGVTAGNGAIYAVRAERLPAAAALRQPRPLLPLRRSPSAACARSTCPAARAEEKMVPTLEGEFARKRRMMVGLWDIVVGEGMLRPRGYPPLYAFELASHRLLRYLTPFLHLVALARQPRPARRGLGLRRRPSPLQLALLAAALLGRLLPLAPLRVARYYVMTTASIAAGLWDRARRGAPGRLGEGRGDPVMPRAARRPRIAVALALARPLARCCCSPRSRSGSAAAAR